MEEEERLAVFIALRELEGWTYHGNGVWEEPDDLKQARRQRLEQERRDRERRWYGSGV